MRKQVKDKKRKIERIEYKDFPPTLLTITSTKELLECFEFKEYILNNFELIQSPSGKKMIMGDMIEDRSIQTPQIDQSNIHMNMFNLLRFQLENGGVDIELAKNPAFISLYKSMLTNIPQNIPQSIPPVIAPPIVGSNIPPVVPGFVGVPQFKGVASGGFKNIGGSNRSQALQGGFRPPDNSANNDSA